MSGSSSGCVACLRFAVPWSGGCWQSCLSSVAGRGFEIRGFGASGRTMSGHCVAFLAAEAVSAESYSACCFDYPSGAKRASMRNSYSDIDPYISGFAVSSLNCKNKQTVKYVKFKGRNQRLPSIPSHGGKLHCISTTVNKISMTFNYETFFNTIKIYTDKKIIVFI